MKIMSDNLVLKNTFLELADQVENEIGDDRELEGKICLYIDGLHGESPFWSGGVRNPVPHYLSSLDAAYSVIPEGRHTELATQDRHSGNWKWILRGGFGIRSEARAKTMTRAILASALRAKAAILAVDTGTLNVTVNKD